MGDVLKMQSAVWLELADLCAKEQQHAADARALWPAIGARMAQLKNEYPSTDEFGVALFRHGIDYNKDDRAAFIWMGSLPPAVLEDALARCQRRSPRTLRAEVESWRDPYYQPSSHGCELATDESHFPKSPENASLAAESDTVEIQEDTKTEKPDDHQNGQRWYARSPLFPLGDDGRLLQIIIGGKNASRAIYALMPKHKKFLRFLIDQIKAGRLAPRTFNSQVFHAQHLVSALDHSFVREMQFSPKDEKPDARACALFMDHFDDILLAAEKGWTYAEFRRVTKGIAAPAAGEVLPQRATTDPILPATAMLADGSVLSPEPIFICGQCLYPSEARPDLEYVDAYVYAHFCRGLVDEFQGMSVATIGMSIAHHGRWLGRQHRTIGSFLSAIGTAIRARGETMEPALWFKLEPPLNNTTG